jgi:hypothetical protein
MSHTFICSCARIHFWWELSVSQQLVIRGDTSIGTYIEGYFAFSSEFLFLNHPKAGQVHIATRGNAHAEKSKQNQSPDAL